MKKVDVLVIGTGDSWKVDNISSLFQLQHYTYHNCAESIKYIQVRFNNDSAQLITRSF